MEITSIQIAPNTHADAKVMATAEVVLNGNLSLRGIKILRGRYGLFLAFPGLSPASPYRAFETLSMRFRKELQTEILQAYRNLYATPIPLFG
ncbi:MAG TPA: septation protein SpoVG family protein [Fibrobacteria bacterium]|nr:septation protein SpoVG family protein [Fibrobacteria bacterium]